MIIAGNEFPQNMTINGISLNWSDIKASPTTSGLSESEKNQIALLMGSIYNFVSKITAKNYTLITPKQIEKRFKKIGYDNVVKIDQKSFSTSMILKVSTMLEGNKPVFISAIPGCKISQAHSWVIDGAKYSSGGTYLLHMNFGWEGVANGYFAYHCLNPSNAVEYDNGKYFSKDDKPYSRHFRIITYDIPDSRAEITINY